MAVHMVHRQEHGREGWQGATAFEPFHA
jgi:hypothetical protein